MIYSPHQRNTWLTQSNEDLLKDCRVDVFRGTGNGGQKRNKTDSAVRLTHLPTSEVASSDETRSQHTNKELACRLLRVQIALHCRCEEIILPSSFLWAPSLTNDHSYSLWLAIVLDVFQQQQWHPANTAAFFKKTTSSFVKSLARDSQVWQYLNRERQALNLSPLRHP